MANYSTARSTHRTTAAGVEDVVTLTQHWGEVEVVNRSTTDTLTINPYTTTALSALGADGTEVIPPNSSLTVRAATTNKQHQIRLWSAGVVPYSVSGR